MAGVAVQTAQADDPIVVDLLRLMTAGLTEAAALSATALRGLPGIQDAEDEIEAQNVIRVVRDLLERVELPPDRWLSRRAILASFGEDEEIRGHITARREAVAALEHLSFATVKRRQRALAKALRDMLAELAEKAAPPSPSLEGVWHAIWQTTVDGRESHDTETVDIHREGRRFVLANREIAPENPRGGYLWTGRLRFADHRTLIGEYAAREGPAKGSLFYVVNATGRFLTGRWVGTNIDRDVNTGLCILARNPDTARERFEHLVEEDRRA